MALFKDVILSDLRFPFGGGMICKSVFMSTFLSLAACGGGGGGSSSGDGGDARDMGEAAAVGKLMEAFPRGRLQEGSRLAPDAMVIQESWTLLARALEAKARGGLSAAAAARGESTCVIDPEEFPLLLSELVHADVVRGLAANLMEVEVRTYVGKVVAVAAAVVVAAPPARAGGGLRERVACLPMAGLLHRL